MHNVKSSLSKWISPKTDWIPWFFPLLLHFQFLWQNTWDWVTYKPKGWSTQSIGLPLLKDACLSPTQHDGWYESSMCKDQLCGKTWGMGMVKATVFDKNLFSQVIHSQMTTPLLPSKHSQWPFCIPVIAFTTTLNNPPPTHQKNKPELLVNIDKISSL